MDWSRHAKILWMARLLKQGGVIAYPTEAVWGLGCDPFNEQAVYRLLALKQREVKQGLILVAADVQQLAPFLRGISEQQRQQLMASWPGPVTWLVADNGKAPDWIRGQHSSVALRVVDHPIVVGLCRAFGGPLVSTSANPRGKRSARNRLDVHRYFHQETTNCAQYGLDAIAPGLVGQRKHTSEIRDLTSGEIIRAG